jgi:hypothetical protein
VLSNGIVSGNLSCRQCSFDRKTMIVVIKVKGQERREDIFHAEIFIKITYIYMNSYINSNSSKI